MRKGQAERLFPMLDEVLAEAGADWASLDAVAVGTGPGNFTGIRISVSAARGLALSLNIPAVGVTLFDALAEGAQGALLRTIAAPRDQVYFQMPGSEEIGLSSIEGLPVPPPGTVCVGHRAEDVAAHFGLAHRPAAYSAASAIGRVAERRWQEPSPPPAPLYLRPADAAPSRTAPPEIVP